MTVGRALVRLAAVGQMTSTSSHADNLAQVSEMCARASAAGAKLLCVPEAFSFIGGHYTETVAQAEPLDGDRLGDDEIMAFLFLMVVAGNETTTKLLGNAAFWGARNPDQLAGVHADHARIPLWVEETLRYDTSSQILARTVVEDIEFYGTTLHDGDTLLLMPGSAHRDERVFDDPDEFRIGRDIGSKLLSFGSGAHFCLGAHLARMEARVALTELFERISGYEVDEANAVRVHSSNVRGFANLPITVKKI